MGKMKIFMAGMPGSGKTAYIVSTWNLLAETGMDTKLYKKVGEMPEHYEKIDEISNQVLLYRKLERTKEDEDTELKIKLYDKQENEFDIDIPDLAGEIFRDLVSDRRIKKEMVVRLKESSGILFFVYYKNMSKETRIPLPAGEDGAKEQNIEDSISDKQSETEDEKKVSLNKGREANQSEVVELLQALLELRGNTSDAVPIRFVLSAWDMVEKEYGKNISPEQFVKEKFPLLYQFVCTNDNRIKAEFWGISALGGDYEDPEDLERIQKEEFNAIKVLGPNGIRSSDLTELIYGIGERE